MTRLTRRRAGSSALRIGVRELVRACGLVLTGTGAGWLTLSFLTGPTAWVGAGATLALLAAAWSRLDRARDFRRGGDGERRVGRRLAALERRGWIVAHDVRKPTGGNVDHLVASPGGRVYTIETKLNRFGRPELAQARRHAQWAARRLRVPATPILCVANGRARPRMYAGVWCVGAARVVGFLTGLDRSLEGGSGSGPRGWRRRRRIRRRLG
ncbi:MAG TPA: nuclease-related domain-containing protein [Solirubrobacteraceae bacterium]|jgi:hypothetical protein|nr:nuclease-related domain-containing protein [Solirubrobacteraceae bacterium]